MTKSGAFILFSKFMNELPKNETTKIICYQWQELKGDEKKRHFLTAFNAWISCTCKNYIPDSTDPLDSHIEHNLFYNPEVVTNTVLEAYNDSQKIRLHKSTN